jgi:hypothetical protein
MVKKELLVLSSGLVLATSIFYSCRKDVGMNPLLAYSDKALYDSAKNESAFIYYKNLPNTVYSGTTGPHGSFKLKFNKVANSVLTDNGKLPIGQKFPDGSFIVKEIQGSGLYAVMYKRTGSWLWAEFNADGSTYYSVTKDPEVCTSCHNQSGQRDQVVTFNFY